MLAPPGGMTLIALPAPTAGVHAGPRPRLCPLRRALVDLLDSSANIAPGLSKRHASVNTGAREVRKMTTNAPSTVGGTMCRQRAPTLVVEWENYF